ncbi:MAG: hypothetical protein MMC23_005232 [Stictis urceolatum]|nr:hypothetical protein [Stictis urceolata]
MDQVAFFEQPTVSLAETSLLTPTPSVAQDSPASSPKPEERKSVKKRKSWGQELPTPKTNLPPRKRAKTDDEKEQRRIERVLRNRQAAQSSRERKRQEVEKLEGERDVIHDENRQLKVRLMAAEEEKFSMRQQLAQMRDLLRKNGLQMASPPASPVLGAEMFKDTVIKQELDSFPSLFQASRTHSLDPRASVVSTAPSESLPSTPTQTETFGDTTASDLAQHPAEMLSSRRNSNVSAATPVSSLSDGTFDNLFESGNSPLPATSFFEEGYAAEGGDPDADNVQFNTLVDFNTEIPTQATGTDSFSFGEDSQFDPFPFDFNSSNDTIVDFSHQSAAAPSNLQPCIGASS